MAPLRILVFGRSGQLAQELLRLKSPLVASIECIGRETIDLLQLEGLPDVLASREFDVVVNAAAYTAVDQAESEPEIAFALNREAPRALARICAARGQPLVHISTDYVFDGAKTSPYAESDSRNPIGVYGRSKAEGEEAILAEEGCASVLRTSWVYSAFSSNFVKTMLRLSETRAAINVVADTRGRPTWAYDLAEACVVTAAGLVAGKSEAKGVFHYAGAGDASWADLAETVFASAQARGAKGATVNRITTAEYPTLAHRPVNSRLDTDRFEHVFGLAPRPWREAVDLCVEKILAGA